MDIREWIKVFQPLREIFEFLIVEPDLYDKGLQKKLNDLIIPHIKEYLKKKDVLMFHLVIYDYLTESIFFLPEVYTSEDTQKVERFQKFISFIKPLGDNGIITLLTSKWLKAEVGERKVIITKFKEESNLKEEYRNLEELSQLVSVDTLSNKIEEWLKLSSNYTLLPNSVENAKLILEEIREFTKKSLTEENKINKQVEEAIIGVDGIKPDNDELIRRRNYYTYIKMIDPEIKYLYHFWPPLGKGGKPIFGLVIASKNYLDPEEFIFVLQCLSNASLSFSGKMAEREKRKALRESLRSAIAGIMARNMSHNLGSHVLFYAGSAGEELTNYLQERMDFLSEIITSEPTWSLQLGFFSDVLINFANKKQLSENIALTEGIQKIEVYYHSSKNGTYQKIKVDEAIKGEVSEKFVSIVSGEVGRQAIYSIFENMIRNSAKHAGRNSESMELNVRLDKEGYSECDDWIRIRAWDSLSKEDSLEKVRPYIEEPIIDKNGVILPTGWGIKEMRACTSFLRKIPPLDTEFKGEKTLEALCVNECGEEQSQNGRGFLCYQFYLPRPKEALIIGEEAYKKLRNKQQKLKTYGIDVEKKFDIYKERYYPHELLILEKGSNSLEEIKKSPDLFPARIFIVQDNEKTNLETQLMAVHLGREKYEELIKNLQNLEISGLLSLWKLWVSNLCRSEIPKLIVNLVASKEESLSIPAWRSIPREVATIYWKGDDISVPVSDKFIVNDYHGVIRELAGRRPSVKWVYYEYGSLKSPLWSHLINPPEEEFLIHKIVFNLIEAGLMRILVVDERVFNFLKGSISDRPDLEWKGVYTLEDFNYEHPTSDDGQKIIEKISNSSYHAIIIHQGILDKMNGEVAEVKEFIEKIKSKIPLVVVTSGRGVPPLIPSNARYLPASSILNFVCTQKNKFYLTQAIFAARAKGKN